MRNILADLSEPALRMAAVSNFYAFFELLERSPHVDFLRRPPLIGWRTAILHPLFQGVLVNGTAPGEEERLVREVRDSFAAKGIPGFLWWFGPGVDQTPWEAALRHHGFTSDDDPPAMAVALDELVEPPLPARLRIERVTDPTALQVWNQTFGTGYELPPAMTAHFGDLISDIGFDRELRHYLAYQNETPVAAASLWLAAGVAGIYNVATIPEARGQGIGSAITVAPLQEARALGYRAAILQSSQMGFSVYQRLGFRFLCGMEHYAWSRPG